MDGGTTAAILSLGLLIADKLDDRDLLGRWMAHYLAERLQALEGLDGEARRNAEDQIVVVILQLWHQREHVHFERNPAVQLDAVERALERLDPERPPWSNHRPFAETFAPSQAETEVNEMLSLALRVDRLSADVVRDLISHAAATALNSEADWVTAVRAAQIPTPHRALERLLRLYGPEEAEGEVEVERATTHSPIERMIEALQDVTQALQELNSETE